MPGGFPFLRLLAVAAVLATAQGCQPAAPDPADAAGDAADAEPEADATEAADAEREADARPGIAGPLTLVATEITVLEERICDIDGDGVLDNAVADLGSPSSSLLAQAVSAMVNGNIDENMRFGLHLPLVSDLAAVEGPTVAVAVVGLKDTDLPKDPQDDFSGDEPFYADADHVDACGRPLYYEPAASLVHGELSAGPTDAFPLPLGTVVVPSRGGQLRGTIEPWGQGAVATVCAAIAIADLGAACGLTAASEECDAGGADLSLLEELLAGGSVVGMPAIPGLRPNVDLDGDGLERFEVDDEGRITLCIDGDGAALEGRGCWQDVRFADGMALAIEVHAVPCRLVARQPGWEYRHPPCETGPIQSELFGFGEAEPGCAGLDEVCDPRSESPCCGAGQVCTGANHLDYRCALPCEAAPCPYADRVGICRDGNCHPIGSSPPAIDCTPGEACETVYGATGECLRVGTPEIPPETTCYETCEGRAAACGDADHECLPRLYGETGVCAYYPSFEE